MSFECSIALQNNACSKVEYHEYISTLKNLYDTNKTVEYLKEEIRGLSQFKQLQKIREVAMNSAKEIMALPKLDKKLCVFLLLEKLDCYDVLKAFPQDKTIINNTNS